MRTARTLLVIALGITIVLSLGSPGASGPAQRPVVILQGVDVATLDPQYSSSLPDVNVIIHVFEKLMTYDNSIRLVPHLAESYRLIDPLTWEFTLKKGRTFHNGEPVNAEAVRFGLMRGKSFFDKKQADVQYLFALLMLDRVDVVDQYTVRIKTTQPNPLLPYHLAHDQTSPFPPKYYTQTPQASLNRRPVGSGPYRIVEWIPDERVVIEAWPGYPGGQSAIQRLIFRPVPEAATRIAELRAGNADLIVNVPPDLADDVARGPGFRLETVPGMRRIFIGIKQGRHPALADKRVREALNHAFNCEGMMRSLLAGRGKCSANIANLPEQNAKIRPYPYDPAQAARLLDEAGWRLNPATGVRERDGRPLALNFDCPNGRYIRDKEICQVIASDLQKVGIRINLQVFDWSVYVRMSARRGSGFHDLYLLGSGPGFNCQDDLALVQKDSGSNRAEWSNDRFESVWAKLSVEFNLKKRVEMCHQLEEIARAEAPLIFIWFQTDFYGVSNRLAWKPRADERIWLGDARLR